MRGKLKLHTANVGHEKSTMNCKTMKMPLPEKIYVYMHPHIGEACKPIVKVGDKVKVGQLIGEATGPISAPMHASVSGTVVAVERLHSSRFSDADTVVIESDGLQTVDEHVKPPVIESREDFIRSIRESGLVGLGGAAFPTNYKLNVKPEALEKVHTLIVNGAECEPFITSDYRTMMEDTQDIIDGILLVMKYLELSKCTIAIEKNKPEAIKKLQAMLHEQNHPEITIRQLDSRYPQGAERMLVYTETGKMMKAGELPVQYGVILNNITTIAFIGRYARTGMPLISRRVTVDGSAVAEPKNVNVILGTPIRDVIEFCGGYKEKPGKILMGGPMMGVAVASDQEPVIKNNNAILVFSEAEAVIPDETKCLRCGKCYQICPLNLFPGMAADAYEKRDEATLKKLNIAECMECGSCSYICPARRPLTLINRKSKQFLKGETRK